MPINGSIIQKTPASPKPVAQVGAGNDALVTQESSTAGSVAQVASTGNFNVATVTQRGSTKAPHASVAQAGKTTKKADDDVITVMVPAPPSQVGKTTMPASTTIGPIKPSPTSASLGNSHEASVSQQIADGARSSGGPIRSAETKPPSPGHQ